MAYDNDGDEMPAKPKGKAPGHTHNKDHDKFLHKAMPDHGAMNEGDYNSEC